MFKPESQIFLYTDAKNLYHDYRGKVLHGYSLFRGSQSFNSEGSINSFNPMSFAIKIGLHDTFNLKQAMQQENREQFIDAMEKEIKNDLHDVSQIHPRMGDHEVDMEVIVVVKDMVTKIVVMIQDIILEVECVVAVGMVGPLAEDKQF